MEANPISLIVWVTLLGIGAQWLGWRFNFPVIILLSVAGLAAGPGFGWIDPRVQMGPFFGSIISLFVAVILFDGGLNLKLHEFVEAGRPVQRLVTVGLIASWFLGGLAAHFLGNLSWPVAVLFGAITVVTGPTVILPMLRQARLNRRTASLLKWEGIINDPVGGLIAILALEFFLYAKPGEAALQVFINLGTAVGVAVLLGMGSGYILSWAYHRGFVPEYLKPPVILGMIVIISVLANRAQDEAGLLAATLMGAVLGNLRLRSIAELRRFQEHISVLLVSAVFILLVASLNTDLLMLLDWHSAALLAAVIFVVRPASVLLALVGSVTTKAERLLVAWVAPRGIVAVAIAGVVASKMDSTGSADAQVLVPLILCLVLLTVVMHGATVGWLARRLNLASPVQNGILIVGASPWTTELARTLHAMKVPVVLTDTSWESLKPARLSGIRVYYGEILSEERERSLELNDIDHLFAATPNDAYNALVCTHFAKEFERTRIIQLPMHRQEEHDSKALANTVRGLVAIGPEGEFEKLLHHYYEGWTFQKTKLSNQFSYQDYLGKSPEGSIQVLVIRSDGSIHFNSKQFPLEPQPGDTIVSYAPPEGGS